ncbi:MAG: hypothetical protein H0U67_06315 [Gemmatimonadetes bacterium]|nr:hypothetical protein [Gemmatimonadota bacterium]
MRAIQIHTPLAVANALLESSTSVPNGRRWRFAEALPINTDLAAFAARPWMSWEDAPGGHRPMTLYERLSQRDVVMPMFRSAPREALRWPKAYCALEYPFQKYDSVLGPAFP